MYVTNASRGGKLRLSVCLPLPLFPFLPPRFQLVCSACRIPYLVPCFTTIAFGVVVVAVVAVGRIRRYRKLKAVIKPLTIY